MKARDGKGLTMRLGGRRTSPPRRSPFAAALLALLVACFLFAAAAPAGASTAPGKPTAKAPTGTITQAKPTFKWSRAARADKYELRAYRGKTQLLKKAGLTKLSWKSSRALPTNVALTWKVRGSNAGGNGAWSKSLTFKVVTKAITAFSFAGLSPAVTGSINESAHTIALTVQYGTPVTALAPTITITGVSVSPASGVATNFSSPVLYTVTAADASTQDYTVTVTVAAAVIGQSYGGGKIAYILQAGDPGYVDDGQTRGLVAAAADQSTGFGIRWYNGVYTATGATGTALGTGLANTNTIIVVQGATETSYAAGLARAYNGGGFADWYLPSKDELHKLCLNRVAIGGFELDNYWSSSEHGEIRPESEAWDQDFSGSAAAPGLGGKQYAGQVRAVRTF